VAPVWQTGLRNRAVYLPAGTWIDYWDPTRRFVGPTNITTAAALDRLPLYVRAGAILALEVGTAATGDGSAASVGRLTREAYPSGTTTFILHEDDGDLTATLSESGCASGRCVRLDIGARPRGYIIRMLSASPTQVALDGQPVRRTDSFAAFEAAAA